MTPYVRDGASRYTPQLTPPTPRPIRWRQRPPQTLPPTHSPLLLSALRPDEVVALELDERDTVRRRDLEVDPRLLTGSELYAEIFETQSLPAQELGRVLDDYRFWARNPNRSVARDRDVQQWRRRLEAEGIAPPFEPVPRAEGAR